MCTTRLQFGLSGLAISLFGSVLAQGVVPVCRSEPAFASWVVRLGLNLIKYIGIVTRRIVIISEVR